MQCSLGLALARSFSVTAPPENPPSFGYTENPPQTAIETCLPVAAASERLPEQPSGVCAGAGLVCVEAVDDEKRGGAIRRREAWVGRERRQAGALN